MEYIFIQNVFTSILSDCYHVLFHIFRYQIRDRKEPLNYEHCVLVMKQYGKLHALSLALRHQNPEEFQKLASHLQSNLMAGIAKEHMQPSYDMRCDKIMEHLDPEKYSMELEKIKKLKPRCFDIMSNKINSSTNDRHAVIIHGDSWINNMLFRYDVSIIVDICYQLRILRIFKYGFALNKAYPPF